MKCPPTHYATPHTEMGDHDTALSAIHTRQSGIMTPLPMSLHTFATLLIMALPALTRWGIRVRLFILNNMLVRTTALGSRATND